MMLLEAATAATVAEVNGVLEVLGAVADFVFGRISSVVEIVMANPLLLIPIGIITAYTVISVFKRLF